MIRPTLASTQQRRPAIHAHTQTHNHHHVHLGFGRRLRLLPRVRTPPPPPPPPSTLLPSLSSSPSSSSSSSSSSPSSSSSRARFRRSVRAASCCSLLFAFVGVGESGHKGGKNALTNGGKEKRRLKGQRLRTAAAVTKGGRVANEDGARRASFHFSLHSHLCVVL